MTTPVTPNPNPYAEFGGVSVDAPTPSTPTAQPQPPSSPSTTNPYAEFGGIAIPDENTPPPVSPEEKASQSRQMLVSGLTGMPTPNMTAADRENFEKGKAAGAISVPLVAGATTGMTAISEALPSVLMHTTEGIKALNAWAIKNPFQAVMLYHAVKELLPGAKKAMGIIKAMPIE